MPERNLVANRFLNSLALLVIVLTFVCSQAGCNRFGNASLDDEFITFDQDRPSFNTEPTAEPVQNPTRRFLNDPQKALDELNEAGGELGVTVEPSTQNSLDALVAEKEAGARIVDISNQLETQTTNVKLTATPPAPVIRSSELPVSPINRNSFEYSDLRPSSNQTVAQTASQAANQTASFQSPIKLEARTSDDDCGHADCDCMKPKLEPKLPFAQPVAPPIPNFAPPSELVSQPLSPILFDQVTRQVGQASETQMKNNTLRRVAPTLEKPASTVAKQEFNATA